MSCLRTEMTTSALCSQAVILLIPFLYEANSFETHANVVKLGGRHLLQLSSDDFFDGAYLRFDSLEIQSAYIGY